MIKALVSDFTDVLYIHPQSFAPRQWNQELLDFYSSLKSNVDLYIFTSAPIGEDSELEPVLKPLFKKVFSAPSMGLRKYDSESYKKLAEMISLKPEEILFIDDSASNVAAARNAGMKAVQYVDNEKVQSEVAKLLSD